MITFLPAHDFYNKDRNDTDIVQTNCFTNQYVKRLKLMVQITIIIINTRISKL